ncbi:MAG: hypothetical protein LBU55_03010 [Elusimicrobiota bacterium]|jgi:hypothetical protein|nr:hypothetical protein [Elusimicrobiota bacterium]
MKNRNFVVFVLVLFVSAIFSPFAFAQNPYLDSLSDSGVSSENKYRSPREASEANKAAKERKKINKERLEAEGSKAQSDVADKTQDNESSRITKEITTGKENAARRSGTKTDVKEDNSYRPEDINDEKKKENEELVDNIVRREASSSNSVVSSTTSNVQTATTIKNAVNAPLPANKRNSAVKPSAVTTVNSKPNSDSKAKEKETPATPVNSEYVNEKPSENSAKKKQATTAGNEMKYSNNPRVETTVENRKNAVSNSNKNRGTKKIKSITVDPTTGKEKIETEDYSIKPNF